MSKMTIQLTNESDDEGGCQEMVATYNDAKLEASQSEGEWLCPEDRSFCRDLNSPESYLPFIKMAYECGKNGHALEIL